MYQHHSFVKQSFSSLLLPFSKELSDPHGDEKDLEKCFFYRSVSSFVTGETEHNIISEQLALSGVDQ